MALDQANIDALTSEAGSALLADAGDQIGLRDTTLETSFDFVGVPRVIVGFARTVQVVDVEAAPDRHYGQEIDFIDSLRPNDLVVVDSPTRRAACWGELFSTASAARGAVGAVIHGLVRDTARTAELDWPVLALGARPADSLGRISMRDPDLPITLGSVTVRPGDLVVADGDGVTVIPEDAAEEVASRALTKGRTENRARQMLSEGALLREAWEEHGVL